MGIIPISQVPPAPVPEYPKGYPDLRRTIERSFDLCALSFPYGASCPPFPSVSDRTIVRRFYHCPVNRRLRGSVPFLAPRDPRTLGRRYVTNGGQMVPLWHGVSAPFPTETVP